MGVRRNVFKQRRALTLIQFFFVSLKKKLIALIF